MGESADFDDCRRRTLCPGNKSRTAGPRATGELAVPDVYLHYVFDLWAQRWREKHAPGDVIVVRYADDFIGGV